MPNLALWVLHKMNPVELRVKRREVLAAMAATRFAAGGSAGPDCAGKGIGVALQKRQLLGATQWPGQPPDRFAGALLRGVEAPA